MSKGYMGKVLWVDLSKSETWEEDVIEDVITDGSEQAQDDAISATAKLDTTEDTPPATVVMEEEILPDTPPENLYATKVLRETFEDASATEQDASATEGEADDENE